MNGRTNRRTDERTGGRAAVSGSNNNNSLRHLRGESGSVERVSERDGEAGRGGARRGEWGVEMAASAYEPLSVLIVHLLGLVTGH